MRTVGGGVFELKVYHDDDCPVLAAIGSQQRWKDAT
jgi:hypothetical protein